MQCLNSKSFCCILVLEILNYILLKKLNLVCNCFAVNFKRSSSTSYHISRKWFCSSPYCHRNVETSTECLLDPANRHGYEMLLDGKPPEEGDVMKMPQLAQTFKVFGNMLKVFQLLKKLISSSAFFDLMDTFSNLRRSQEQFALHTWPQCRGLLIQKVCV